MFSCPFCVLFLCKPKKLVYIFNISIPLQCQYSSSSGMKLQLIWKAELILHIDLLSNNTVLKFCQAFSTRFYKKWFSRNWILYRLSKRNLFCFFTGTISVSLDLCKCFVLIQRGTHTCSQQQLIGFCEVVYRVQSWWLRNIKHCFCFRLSTFSLQGNYNSGVKILTDRQGCVLFMTQTTSWLKEKFN